MNVYITSTYPLEEKGNFTPVYLSESAIKDPFHVHHLTSSPEAADMIIFAESHRANDPFFFEVLRNPLYKKYKNKCYLYHDNDYALTLMPTVSPSIGRSFYDPYFHRPFEYIIQLSPNKYIDYSSPIHEKKYLFSFIGAARTNPVRYKLLQLPADNAFLSDTSNTNSWELSDAEKDAYFKQYYEVSAQSQFILCPGGYGPSSYRLFETMKMGLPPVIISDDWIPVNGPDWDSFSIRIAEKDWAQVPSILEKMQSDADRMGKLARLAWEQYFSKPVQFHYLVEACRDLNTYRGKVGFGQVFRQLKRFTEPFYARSLARYCKNKIKEKVLSK